MGILGNADRLVGIKDRKDAKPTLGVPREIMDIPNPKKEWYSRGYLPHRDLPGLLQMVTYHLADSLPQSVVERLNLELQALPPEEQELQRHEKIESLIDAGHGSCILRHSQIAALVVENWRHYEGKRYDLMEWVVMPNHVHVLIRVHEGFSLSKIVQAWKGYTGKMINEHLRGISGNADHLVGTKGGRNPEDPMGIHGNADRLVGIKDRKDAKPTLGVPREIMDIPNPKKEWYSRGYLPHRDLPGLLQMVTYHLADSLPQSVVERLNLELQALPPEEQELQRHEKIESLIDAGHGSCILRHSQIAALVVENWRHYEGKRYDLMEWVVMPNHVHVLIRVHEGFSLSKIVQAWKGYTGKMINEHLRGISGNADHLVGTKGGRNPEDPMGIHGNADRLVGMKDREDAKPTLGVPRVWHREYWDRHIRNGNHLRNAVEYIHQNPVKAGLVTNIEDWPWSSAK